MGTFYEIYRCWGTLGDLPLWFIVGILDSRRVWPRVVGVLTVTTRRWHQPFPRSRWNDLRYWSYGVVQVQVFLSDRRITAGRRTNDRESSATVDSVLTSLRGIGWTDAIWVTRPSVCPFLSTFLSSTSAHSSVPLPPTDRLFLLWKRRLPPFKSDRIRRGTNDYRFHRLEFRLTIRARPLFLSFYLTRDSIVHWSLATPANPDSR